MRVANSEEPDHLGAAPYLAALQDRVGVGRAESDLPELPGRIAVRSAPHRQLLGLATQQQAPESLDVEPSVIERDRVSRSAGEVEQRLGDLAARDGVKRAVCLGVGLFKQADPELRAGGTRERKPRVGHLLGPAGLARARQPIVHDHRLPFAVEEEPDAIAPCRRHRGVGEEPCDEVVPLRHYRQRRQEPAVADPALPQIAGREPEIRDDDEVRKALPLVACGLAAAVLAVGPRKKPAATTPAGPGRLAEVVGPALVRGLFLDLAAPGRSAAPAARWARSPCGLFLGRPLDRSRRRWELGIAPAG